MMPLLASQGRRIAAAGLIVASLWWAALPAPSAAERTRRAEAFRFESTPLPQSSDRPRSTRPVHPSLQRIVSWISAVGASVALTDLDGDGLAGEICHVDTRFDEVRISATARPEPFSSFVLPLGALRYDPATMAPMGCLPGDFNEDGRTDLLVYFWGRTPMLFVRSGEALSASAFAARELIAGDARWFTNAATRADVDGDGHGDLIVANYFPDGARILDASSPEWPQTMQHSMTRAANGGGKHVFLWNGADRSPGGTRVTFREVNPGLPRDAAHRWTLAVGAADLDGDRLPEIYLANDFGPDSLLRNLSTPGLVRFETLVGRRDLLTPASKTLGRDSFKGMGVDFADVNGDGIPDIYVSNIAAERALEESHFLFTSTGRIGADGSAYAPYVDRSEALGLSRSDWGWDAKLDDFDNDGVFEAVQATGFLRGSTSRWPELQELATANDQLLNRPGSWPPFAPGDDLSGHSAPAFFARHADGRYYDVADLVGLGAARVSRGLAIADMDGDGRLDLAIANQWDQSFLFRNRSPQAGRFLGLRLRRPLDQHAAFRVEDGVRAGVPTTEAIGASVQLWDGAALVGSREVDGGNGHSGRRSPDLHFGLGDRRAPVRAVIRWRAADGSPRTHSFDLTAGWHTVVLGEP